MAKLAWSGALAVMLAMLVFVASRGDQEQLGKEFDPRKERHPEETVSLDAGTLSDLHDETRKFYKDFQAASVKGPESAEFTAYYARWKQAQPDMLKTLGHPRAGSTASAARQAVLTLGSRVESFKMKLDQRDQQMYEDSLKSKLDQLKKELGR